MTDPPSSPRNSGIDALRGVSILSVVLLHLNIRVPFSTTFLGSLLPKPVYKILFWSGFYGVCVFFVISGFLITTSALNKWGALPRISLRGFYAMRFARIMPLLAALMLVLSALHLLEIPGFVIDPGKTSLGRAVFAALTFHINWLEIEVGYLPGPWDVLWSLSIEEAFYLFFPLVCVLVRKEWPFAALAAVFLVVSPLARTQWYPGNELADHNHLAYMDAIALGCVAALVAQRKVLSRSLETGLSLSGWGLILLVIGFRSVVFGLGLTALGLNVSLLALGTALVLIGLQQRVLRGEQAPGRCTGWLRYWGRNSYEIYLTHMFVVIGLVEAYTALGLKGEWAWLLYLAGVLFSGLLGDAVARYFSNPCNAWLRAQLK